MIVVEESRKQNVVVVVGKQQWKYNEAFFLFFFKKKTSVLFFNHYKIQCVFKHASRENSKTKNYVKKFGSWNTHFKISFEFFLKTKILA